MINNNSSIAMYEQIANILRSEIADRALLPGSCIGPLGQLAERFGVSLITVRKALQVLEKDNLVVTRQGKGTFVNDILLQAGDNRLYPLSSIIQKHNLKADITVVEMKVVSTPAFLPENVRSGLGRECMYIDRLHKIGEHAVGDHKIYLPVEYGGRLTEEDIRTTSVYRLYQQKLGVQLGRGTQLVRAAKADKAMSSLLGVAPGTPMLVVTREAYSAEGRLIEYMEASYEYTQYSFKVELELSAE